MATSGANKQVPTELDLAACNEADHTVVGVVQGRYTEYILLMQHGEKWGGKIEQDLDFRHHLMPELPPHSLYARIGYPVPLGERNFMVVENCILKYAGVVAEELLCEKRGVNSSEVRIGQIDIAEAEGLARSRFPEDQQAQQTMLYNAKSLARKILSNPACWRAVEVLAQELKLAPDHMLKETRIHSLVSQALKTA